ncbi:EMC3, partial [Symbiodinium sp. KB8]
VLRTYLLQYVKSTNAAEVEEVEQKALVARAQRSRVLGGLLSKSSFDNRKEFFGTHALSVKARAPFKNPMASMDGMKTQVAFMATNYGMGYWTQAFFSGFVLVRMPFPLTTRFKQMTQSDLALATLDTSFVSSLSWYMIVLYGIRTLVMLAMGNSSSDAMDEAKMMQMQMGMGAGASPQWDPNSAYKAERTNYELAQYTDLLAASEQELLKQ